MIAEKLSDYTINDMKIIRGNGKILVPELENGIPTGKNLVFDLVKSVGLVPLSKVSKVREVSRKQIVRMAREGKLHLYDFEANRLPKDDKTNVTKFVNYYEIK